MEMQNLSFEFEVIKDMEDYRLRVIPALSGYFNETALALHDAHDAVLLMSSPQRPLGLSKLQYLTPSVTSIAFIEVAQDVRGQKLGYPLFEGVFAHAASRGDTLVITRYTPLGRQRLLPMQNGLQKKFPHLRVHNLPGV